MHKIRCPSSLYLVHHHSKLKQCHWLTVWTKKQQLLRIPKQLINRDADTEEDELPAIIFHVQPVSEDMSELHDGFKPPHLPSHLIKLQINEPFIFGRGEGVDLYLSDTKTSKQHMELSSTLTKTKKGDFIKFEVKNLSENKPLKVNKRNLWANSKICLEAYDQIQIGLNTFTVDINCTEYNSKGMYSLELRLPDEISSTSVEEACGRNG